MKKHFYTYVTILLAPVLWFTDTTIDYFIFHEPDFEIIPSDLIELWMRSTIILLVIAFGIYVDYSSRKLLEKEKQLEATRIYDSMLNATQHILNNLLNQMQLFRIEAQKSKDFDPEITELFNTSIEEAQVLIRRLSAVDTLDQKNIWASVDPESIDHTNKIEAPFIKQD
ncbi:MAG: hypothetical protein OEZ38_09280 [Gammaproteobacteria bacterium]|nr:hypothetical protein [Gammaproteobacteria bacterium]